MAVQNIHGNSFGTTSATYGGGKNVWHEAKAKYPVGGIVDISDYNIGDVIPAGSMCYFDQSAKTVKIVKADDSANLAKVNGLLFDDIYIDAAAKGANGAVTASPVYAGEIYADRCEEVIPQSVWALLPQIVAIREA